VPKCVSSSGQHDLVSEISLLANFNIFNCCAEVQTNKIAQNLGWAKLDCSKGSGPCILALRILGPLVRRHGPEVFGDMGMMISEALQEKSRPLLSADIEHWETNYRYYNGMYLV